MPDDVRDRFGPVAANYARAKFHTSSERLREVLDLAQPQPTDMALDVATGTGNTALALAPFVRRVVGLDVTTDNLAAARQADVILLGVKPIQVPLLIEEMNASSR